MLQILDRCFDIKILSAIKFGLEMKNNYVNDMLSNTQRNMDDIMMFKNICNSNGRRSKTTIKRDILKISVQD